MRPLAISGENMLPARSPAIRPTRVCVRFAFKALCTSCTIVLTFSAGAAAQRPTSSHFAPSHFNAPSGNFALARSPHPGRRSSRVAPITSLPFPLFGDNFNSGDIDSSGNPVGAEPPAFLLQAMREMTGSATASMGQAIGPHSRPQPSSNDPLMIELQNGRYVRIESAPVDGEALPLAPKPAATTKNPAPAIRTNPAQPSGTASATALPSVVLIFHDGHSEEVRDYTIANGFLYARGDYYSDGYWNKSIELAGIDVLQTLKYNEGRGVRFVLPAASNEVITRP